MTDTYEEFTEAVAWLDGQINVDGVYPELDAPWMDQFVKAAQAVIAMADEVRELRDDAEFLNKLRAAGVDNWQGYDIACSM